MPSMSKRRTLLLSLAISPVAMLLIADTGMISAIPAPAAVAGVGGVKPAVSASDDLLAETGVGDGFADTSGIDFTNCSAWPGGQPTVVALTKDGEVPEGNSAGFRVEWDATDAPPWRGETSVNFTMGVRVIEVSGGPLGNEYHRSDSTFWMPANGPRRASSYPTFSPRVASPKVRVRVAFEPYVTKTYPFPSVLNRAVCWSEYSEPFEFYPEEGAVPACGVGRPRYSRHGGIGGAVPLTLARAFPAPVTTPGGDIVAGHFQSAAADLTVDFNCGDTSYRSKYSSTRTAFAFSEPPVQMPGELCTGTILGGSGQRSVRLSGVEEGPCWVKVFTSWTFPNFNLNPSNRVVGDNEDEVAGLAKTWTSSSGVRVFANNYEIPSDALTVSNGQVTIDSSTAGLADGTYSIFVVDSSAEHYYLRIDINKLEVTIYNDCAIVEVGDEPGTLVYNWYPTDDFTASDTDCLSEYPPDYPYGGLAGQPIEPRPGNGPEDGSFGLSAKSGGLGRYGIYIPGTEAETIWGPGWSQMRGEVEGQELSVRERGIYATLDATTPATLAHGNVYHLRHDFDAGANPAKNAIWRFVQEGGAVEVVTETQSAPTIKMQAPDSADTNPDRCLRRSVFPNVADLVGGDGVIVACGDTTQFLVSGFHSSGIEAKPSEFAGSATTVSGGTCELTTDFRLITTKSGSGPVVCDITFTRPAFSVFQQLDTEITVRSMHETVSTPDTPDLLAPTLREVSVSHNGLNLTTLRVMFEALPAGQTKIDGLQADGITATSEFYARGVVHYVLEYATETNPDSWTEIDLDVSTVGVNGVGYCASDEVFNPSDADRGNKCEKLSEGVFGQARYLENPQNTFTHGETYRLRMRAQRIEEGTTGGVNDVDTRVDPSYSDVIEWVANFTPAAPSLLVDSGATTFHMAWTPSSIGAAIGQCFGSSDNRAGAWEIQYTTDPYETGAERTWTSLTWERDGAGDWTGNGVSTIDGTCTDTEARKQSIEGNASIADRSVTSYNWSPLDLERSTTMYFRVRGLSNATSAVEGLWSNEVPATLRAPEIQYVDDLDRDAIVTFTGSFPQNDTSLNGNNADGVRMYELSFSKDRETWTDSIDYNEITVGGTEDWASSCDSPLPTDVYGSWYEGEVCTADFRTVWYGATYESGGNQLALREPFEFGIEYSVRVRALNEQNLSYLSGVSTSPATSPWSEPFEFTIGRRPTLENVTLNAVPGPCRVTFDWTEPSNADAGFVGIDSYILTYRTADRTTSPPTLGESVVVNTGDGLSYVLNGLTGGQFYYVQLSGENRYGSSTAPTFLDVGVIAPDGCSETGVPSAEKPGAVAQWTAATVNFDIDATNVAGCYDARFDAKAEVTQVLVENTVSIDELCNTDMSLEGENGAEDAVGDATLGTLTFFTDADGVARGQGFKPGTIAEVWLNSEPTFLGNVVVEADGTWEKVFDVPAGITTGEHTIVAEGVTTTNRERSLYAGVVIADRPAVPATRPDTVPETPTPETTTTVVPEEALLPATGRSIPLIVIVLLASSGCALVISSRRRFT